MISILKKKQKNGKKNKGKGTRFWGSSSVAIRLFFWQGVCPCLLFSFVLWKATNTGCVKRVANKLYSANASLTTTIPFSCSKIQFNRYFLMKNNYLDKENY